LSLPLRINIDSRDIGLTVSRTSFVREA